MMPTKNRAKKVRTNESETNNTSAVQHAGFFMLTDADEEPLSHHSTVQLRSIFARRARYKADFFVKVGGRIMIDVAKYHQWLRRGAVAPE